MVRQVLFRSWDINNFFAGSKTVSPPCRVHSRLPSPPNPTPQVAWALWSVPSSLARALDVSSVRMSSEPLRREGGNGWPTRRQKTQVPHQAPTKNTKNIQKYQTKHQWEVNVFVCWCCLRPFCEFVECLNKLMLKKRMVKCWREVIEGNSGAIGRWFPVTLAGAHSLPLMVLGTFILSAGRQVELRGFAVSLFLYVGEG